MKIGLVLSGGGAKGSYQVGLFRALEQLGLRSWVTAISGCSIGSLNALIYASGGPDSWIATWNSMGFESLLVKEPGAVMESDEGFPRKLVELAALLYKRGLEISSLSEFLAQRELLPFRQDGLRLAVKERVDISKVTSGTPKIWLCAYNLYREYPEYFSLTGLSAKDVTDIAMASSAIPLVFPPVEYNGSLYCDGGIPPPYSRKKNGDRIPWLPLREEGCDLILIIYLSHYDKVEPTGFPAGTRIMELYPSSPLEVVKGTGTLNLSKETMAENLLMGYHDGLAALAPLILELAQGGDGHISLAAHADYNRQLLDEKLHRNKKTDEAFHSKLPIPHKTHPDKNTSTEE